VRDSTIGDNVLVLTRFNPNELPDALPPDLGNSYRGVFVDAETTGREPEVDEVIALAMVPFLFSKEGVIHAVERGALQFEQPEKPIPPEITRITGITDDQVKAAKFDEDLVLNCVGESVLVVAHHAEFDRQFLERRFPVFEKAAWGCSNVDIPWRDYYTATKLEWLMFKHLRMFYDAHDALRDAEAGVQLLCSELAMRPALSYLLDNVRMRWVRVCATGSPYEKKEVLKARGYHWHDGRDGRLKTWYRDVILEELQAERDWLAENADCHQCSYFAFGARERFSNRIGR
jgi:DNA polymerase-3 subunit epsilon